MRLAGSLVLLVAIAAPARAVLTSELFASSEILGVPTANPTQQAAAGPLTDDFVQIVAPGTAAGFGEARASAEVDYGRFALRTELDIDAVGFDTFAVSLDGGTRATGIFSDAVTIHAPGLAGTSGTFVARIDLDGGLDADAFGDDSPFSSSASADVLLSVSAPGFVQIYATCAATGGVETCSGDPLGVRTLPPMPFTYGTPFELSVRADATTFNRTVPNGTSAATSSFAGIVWLGFDEVRDAGGAAIATYTVSSASGTDWSLPAPEPDGALAGAGALLALAATRKATSRACG